MAQKSIDPNIEKSVIEAYTEHKMTAPEIGYKFDMGSTTIYRILDKAGISRNNPTHAHNRQRVIPLDKYEEIANRYANGEFMSGLAKSFSCSNQTIRKVLKKQGVAINPRGNQQKKFTKEEVEEMSRLWEEGYSQHAIGNIFNIEQQMVSRTLSTRGYKKERRIPRGDKNVLWNGGRTLHEDGYILVRIEPNDPMASMRTSAGYVLEHRLVMARFLNRPLTSSETVHHIDGNKTNNSIENLQLRQGKHGKGSVMTCINCRSHNIKSEEV